MAHIGGLQGYQYQSVGGSQANGNPAATMDASGGRIAINGAPVRIVVLALAAATGLTILKLSGFRFNVGVSS